MTSQLSHRIANGPRTTTTDVFCDAGQDAPLRVKSVQLSLRLAQGIVDCSIFLKNRTPVLNHEILFCDLEKRITHDGNFLPKLINQKFLRLIDYLELIFIDKSMIFH